MLTPDAIKNARERFQQAHDERGNQHKSGNGRVDVAAYLDHYGVTFNLKAGEQGNIYALKRCLFDPSHGPNEASIIESPDGKLFYQCFHDSCQKYKWSDARNAISGNDSMASYIHGWKSKKTESDGSDTDNGKQIQAQVLIRLARDADLWHTSDQTAFASIRINGHLETWPVKSKNFRSWLNRLYYQANDRPAAAQALLDVANFLESRALWDGQEQEVFVRLGEHAGKIYLDLGNPDWRAVEINRNGWTIVKNPPVHFRRPRGLNALPEPERGGDLSKLRGFINLQDDQAWILYLSWLVGTLRPTGPYPVMVLLGEQGSSKSTLAKITKSLIDPSTAPLRTQPKEERDLLISATNSWLLGYDNLSGLPGWLSDAFCRLSTGGGFATRQLYSDDDERIFEAKRPLILNGIDGIVNRMDLADRSIFIDLPPLPEDKRRPESELWEAFYKIRPRILGALLDAVSAALSNIDDVRLGRLPRMADFALWVTAAEPALPWESGQFMQTYEANRRQAVEMSLDADPVAVALQTFMATRAAWTGSASDLLAKLEGGVSDQVQKSKAWPKAPNRLSARLKRAATFLRTQGIAIETSKLTNGRRQISITNESIATIATIATATEYQPLTSGDTSGGKINRNESIATLFSGSGDTSGDTKKAIATCNQLKIYKNGDSGDSGDTLHPPYDGEEEVSYDDF